MKDAYFDYYILSYFKEERITTISQIFHIFQGKRTPSMLYLTEINKKHHGFSQFRDITRNELEQVVQKLQTVKYILPKDKGYILSKTGKETCISYFENHYYPKEITNFSNIKLHLPFWERYQLFTQVFSEYSYKNTKYVPIIKHPKHQENVRQLFQAFSNKKIEILTRWKKENIFLFKNMDKKSATVITNLLTGNQIIGKTKEQLATYFKMSALEFNLYFLNCIEKLINIILDNKTQLPLLAEILQQTDQETFLGLSPSTYYTYELMIDNFSLPQIANQRSVKINTVKEHILEIAFIFDDFSYQDFIPKDIYQILNNMFDRDNKLTYKLASEEIRDLEFMYYRLVELERLRQNEE